MANVLVALLFGCGIFCIVRRLWRGAPWWVILIGLAPLLLFVALWK